MKKVLFSIYLLFYSFNVSASICDISIYETYVNLVDFEFSQLGESDTYKVYVSNITGGISIESGRWLSSDGFLDYITVGSVKYINAIVSDGSSCAGEIIKIIEISVNNEFVYSENSYDEDELMYYVDSEIIENESEIAGYSFDEVNEGIVYEVVGEDYVEEEIYDPPVINQNEEIIVTTDESNNYFLIIFLIVGVLFILKYLFNLKRGKYEKVF